MVVKRNALVRREPTPPKKSLAPQIAIAARLSIAGKNGAETDMGVEISMPDCSGYEGQPSGGDGFTSKGERGLQWRGENL